MRFENFTLYVTAGFLSIIVFLQYLFGNMDSYTILFAGAAGFIFREALIP